MISVGADVAQDKIDVCVYDCSQKKVLLEKTILNSRKGFEELEFSIKDFLIKRILIESTGGLEEAFVCILKKRDRSYLY
jgi:transposase